MDKKHLIKLFLFSTNSKVFWAATYANAMFVKSHPLAGNSIYPRAN
jgi:hypothetical protein